MNDLSLDPGTVIDDVPIFPLPQVVLFPDALLPLHIFEPRYRAMTHDALASHGRLVIAQIPEGPDRDARGQPAFCRVSGIGSITHHEALSDGRYNILVRGIGRVALEELPLEKAYRRARATVLGTTAGRPDLGIAQALAMTARAFVSRVRTTSPSFDFTIDDGVNPGALADRCGHYLLVDGTERQRILETLDDSERVRACLEALMRQNEELGLHEILH
jgi:Lon protease-like protein